MSSHTNTAGGPAGGAGPDGLILVGELLVVTAYLIVAGVLFYLALKRDDKERRRVMLLFGFIGLMGGAVHLLNIWGGPAAGDAQLILRLIFGVLALIAAIRLFKAIPGLLAIPSLNQLTRANSKLQEQVEERKKAEAALRETQQELEQRVRERSAQAITANRELEREIENRKKTERRLISTNYELIKKNADLDDFVYYASRDLKGPVLNVAGLVEAIREELPTDNPELGQLFAHLDDSVARINRKLNNLAEVSRIQKPISEEQLGMVSLTEVLDQVKESLREPLQDSGALLRADFTAMPEIYFSRDNLISLLNNLISNSIKYREPQRPLHIFLSSELQDRYAVLKVQDNGIGMDLNRYGQQLFSLFRRFHDHVEGSGIGLYIIKRIMDNNNGKIEVQSVLGEGTTFLLYFVHHEQHTGARV
ncbi:sensor histidine kinase [Sabulibacter ruber]|uniref:sensor histidine kinase n=1 Tax=Sabulibacter ruber TaxID=2811901 RepID=UPI001A9599E0|nr:HAMP domain-containing sensor histidine kinase [Sabulibacter ruber]